MWLEYKDVVWCQSRDKIKSQKPWSLGSMSIYTYPFQFIRGMNESLEEILTGEHINLD